MSQAVSNLAELLRTLSPELNPGVYVFASLPTGVEPARLEPLA